MDLIIVESPTKAKTLSRFLGDEYSIEATYGHVRDLPEKKIGVDVKKNFALDYMQTDKQTKRVDEIKKLSKKAKMVYLATDPDREGEAIAWHTFELLNSKQDKKEKFKRIAFHEITKTAIEHAMREPGELNMQLVNAQQGRRVLDRLVGYKLSPLLWRKVRKGLSAGRVQSVAVRLIVEREREIEAFKPVEFWDVVVELSDKSAKITTKLIEKIGDGIRAHEVEADLRQAKYVVEGVDKRDTKRIPSAPFTTSTLQQTAANRLGWSAKKTMQVAQSLYEEGLITYHRTDSTNIAAEAILAVNNMIKARYGVDYVVGQPRVFRTKSKVAQEAHEAIRPTDVIMDKVVGSRDQERLYELIWKRFVACQMADALGEETKIKVVTGDGKYKMEAKGLIVKFDGWTKLNESETEEENEEGEAKMPVVQPGQALDFVDLKLDQKFTQPPARYNDASLIKTLEEMGIGRPSTYAPTLSTIQDRQYVERLEKRFKPTPLGIAVSDFLVTNFGNIVDYQFTAKMEEQLDEIANGDREWQPVIADFYKPFEKEIESVSETSTRVKVEAETTGEKCPECKEGDVVVRIGKFGRFLACNRYPDCKYKANFQNKIGMKCPKCSDGDVIMRRTKNKKMFYGCSSYPKCDFASWTKPTPLATENAPQTENKV